MASPTELPLVRAAEHLAARRFSEAAGAFRAALSIDPNEPRAYLGLADCACGRGETEEAVDELVGTAQDFAERGFHDAAFQLLGKALTLAPDRLELHIDVAELEAATGRTELAKTRLRNLAEAYRQAGQHDEAEAIGEVIASWEGDVEQAAVPNHVQPAMTEPELEDATMPQETDATHPHGVVSDATVAPPPARKTPPPPPPAKPRSASAAPAPQSSVTRTATPPKPPKAPGTPSYLRPAPSSPPVQLASCLPQADPARRGPTGRHGALRWKPSTVANDAMPNRETEAIVTRVSSPGRPETPARHPSKPIASRHAAKPEKATAPKKAAAPKNPPAKAKKTIAPAPSPKRGGHKLDRLPSREPSASAKPARAETNRAASQPKASKPDTSPKPGDQTVPIMGAVPRSSSKPIAVPTPIAPSATTRYRMGSTPRPTRLQPVDQRPGSQAATSRSVAAPPRTGDRGQAQGDRRSDGTLAAKLRKGSGRPAASGQPSSEPANDQDDIGEEDATRLWAPDHLLVQQ